MVDENIEQLHTITNFIFCQVAVYGYCSDPYNKQTRYTQKAYITNGGYESMIYYNGEFTQGRITNTHTFYTRLFRKTPKAGQDNVVFELSKGQFLDGEISNEIIITNNYAWYAFKFEGTVLYVAAYHIERPNSIYIKVDYFDDLPKNDIAEYLKNNGILNKDITREELIAISEILKILGHLKYYPKSITAFFTKISEALIKYVE